MYLIFGNQGNVVLQYISSYHGNWVISELTPHVTSLHTPPHFTHRLTQHTTALYTTSLHTLLHFTHYLTPHTTSFHTVPHSTHFITPVLLLA